MREKDEITDLFRNRLSGAEMPVRDDFWETLQHDLCLEETGHRKWLLSPKYYRVAAAASVAFVLG
ncbi:MAG: porin family protein, partial [Bacteroides sp.]|nr:porin family protein [Bacteroides sp.]